jgi:hypothetical protein
MRCFNGNVRAPVYCLGRDGIRALRLCDFAAEENGFFA